MSGLLRVHAENFADIQQMRIMLANRANRGGVPMEPELMEQVDVLERVAARELRDEYRATVSPEIQEWVKTTTGLGEPSMARLMGLLGDPINAQPYKRIDKDRYEALPPFRRSVSQLWSYCGVGDPARRLRRGMSQEDAMACGSRRIRSLLYVIAVCCMKNTKSPYRTVYLASKAKRTVKGKTKIRAHEAALREVGKEILRDLYIAAEWSAKPITDPTDSSPTSPQRGGCYRPETHVCRAAPRRAA